MQLVVILSQILLYLCFALLFGFFLLHAVPVQYRPDFNVSKKTLQLSVIGGIIGSFVPALYVIIFIAPRIGLIDSIITVLTVYTVGQAWLAALVLGAILFFMITFWHGTKKVLYSITGVFLLILLVAAVAWSSHASSGNLVLGFSSDLIHLLSVSIWVGLLIVVSWFSTNYNNWLEFLKWFTPVAALCFMTTLLSGIFLLEAMIPSYTDAWLVSYGQGLLLKHLFIIPLAFYAIFNGMFVKVRMQNNPDFTPIPWARLESVLLVIIFTITAYFSQQSPPMHSVSASEISPLFKLLYNGDIVSGMMVHLGVTWYTLLFVLLMVVFIVLTIIAFVKKAPTYVGFVFACIIVFCGYLSLMYSVT